MKYEDIAAVHWSGLRYIADSPMAYQWNLKHGAEKKSVFTFGGAGHCAILEPEKFDERYAVFDGARNEKHEKWQTWQKEHPGMEALKPDELVRVRAIAKAVREHREVKSLLRGGRCEEAVTWTDEVTGLACKGRLDYIRPDVVIDLKTTRDPSPSKFERSAHSYGYAGQLAFYHDGAVRRRLIDGKTRPYIIAVRSQGAPDVAVFQLKQETLDAGRALYRSLLRKLVQCTEADYWPGVAPELQQLGMPAWAENQTLDQEEEGF